MNQKFLSFRIEFDNPDLISTSAEGYDHIAFYLFSNELLRCQDGRKFETAFTKNTQSGRNLKGKSHNSQETYTVTIPP